jgi:nucleolar complex protein 3
LLNGQRRARREDAEHFVVLRGIYENERLKAELNHTLSSIYMYKEYKKHKNKNMKVKTKRKKQL